MVYVDTQTGKNVEKLMGEIGTELHAIKVELNRIGCNYNQELKVKRMEAKQREVLEQLAEKDLPDDVKAEKEIQKSGSNDSDTAEKRATAQQGRVGKSYRKI